MDETHPPDRLEESGDPSRQEDWNRRYSRNEFIWSAEPNRFLVAEAAELPPGRALDLACGEGRNAVWLAARGWRVTAVDFSDVALAKARQLAATRGVVVDWILADVLEYEPEQSAFDLVLLLYLHLPAEERRAVLARASASVAPGGTLFVVGHDLTNLGEGYGGPSRAEVLFTPANVAAELPGLEVEKAERVFRSVATEDGERRAIDALVRARRRGLRVA